MRTEAFVQMVSETLPAPVLRSGAETPVRKM